MLRRYVMMRIIIIFNNFFMSIEDLKENMECNGYAYFDKDVF